MKSLRLVITIMAFGTYSVEIPEKLPTFLQYLRTASPKGIEGKTKFSVEIIWLPSTFDNVTLQTHAFRYVATPKNPLYQDVLDFVEAIDSVKNPLSIVITSFEKKEISVSLDEKKLVTYTAIGTLGYRLTT